MATVTAASVGGRSAEELLAVHAASTREARRSAVSDGYLNLRQAELFPCELGAAFSLLGRCSLTQLGLSQNPNLGPSGAKALAGLIDTDREARRRLRGLYMSGCALRSDGGAALCKQLLEAAEEEESPLRLTHLGLNSNSLGDTAALSLLRSRAATHSLRVLGLSENALGDRVACSLANAVAGSIIERCFLNSNQIGCEGALAWARLLSSGEAPKLRRLGLAHNEIGELGASKLADAAEAAAASLERLCLFANPFLSAADDFATLGPVAARHRLSQLANVHLNGLSVSRLADGSDYYWYHTPTNAPTLGEEEGEEEDEGAPGPRHAGADAPLSSEGVSPGGGSVGAAVSTVEAADGLDQPANAVSSAERRTERRRPRGEVLEEEVTLLRPSRTQRLTQ